MIGQPGGVLEYDAVHIIYDEFREARKVERTYGHAAAKHVHNFHGQI